MKQIIAIIIIAALAGCFGKDPVKSGKEGKPMPEFSMLLADSTTCMRSADFPKGKSSVLIYFSPYCPYCKAQTKDIVDNMKDLKDVHFYLISNFSFAELNEYSKQFQLKRYPNITIGQDTAEIITKYFEITGVPYIAIYKKDKTLSQSFEGKIYMSQMKKAIEE